MHAAYVLTTLARLSRATASCMLTALVAASGARAESTAPSGPVEAIWRKQTMEFHYRNGDQYFTCEEFEWQLSEALLAVGVRRELIIDASCPRGLSGHIRATITLTSPVEATTENLSAATRFSATQRLLAHVNNDTLPTVDSVERFAAQWRAVSLTRSRSPGKGSADCELLRALSEQVLPRLAIHVVRDVPGCFSPRIPPRLIVQALLPIEQRGK